MPAIRHLELSSPSANGVVWWRQCKVSSHLRMQYVQRHARGIRLPSPLRPSRSKVVAFTTTALHMAETSRLSAPRALIPEGTEADSGGFAVRRYEESPGSDNP